MLTLPIASLSHRLAPLVRSEFLNLINIYQRVHATEWRGSQRRGRRCSKGGFEGLEVLGD